MKCNICLNQILESREYVKEYDGYFYHWLCFLKYLDKIRIGVKQ